MKSLLKYKNALILSAVIFILAELALFPLIQRGSGDTAVISCYLAIVCVALFALVTLRGEASGHFIRLGIAFTLVADYFLVIADDSKLEGVIAFIAVQACYFVYTFVSEDRRSVRLANAVSRVALTAVLTVSAFAVLGKDTDALAIASVIYYGNLLVNTVFAFLLGRRNLMFAIGLVLFCMCDLCIGLEVLFSSYLDASTMDFMYGANLNLPWLFYQPSQTLIGLSLWVKARK